MILKVNKDIKFPNWREYLKVTFGVYVTGIPRIQDGFSTKRNALSDQRASSNFWD